MEDGKYNSLRLYKERLNILLDVAQTINEDHSVEALMSEFEILLKEELGVAKIVLFTLDHGEWKTQLSCGVDENRLVQIDVLRDLTQFRKIENLTLTENEALKDFDAVIPLYHNYKIISYLVVGDDEQLYHGISPTIRHLKFIQILANLILVFIENKKMQNRLIQQETLRRELELASTIQKVLVPTEDELLKTSYTDVRSLYTPHMNVGGDYYDVIDLSSYSVGFCIADVSGKGMGAALLMSNFQAMVRALFTPQISLEKLVKELNKRVNENTTNDKFITFFVARYNKITGRLSYVNAGHLPPLVYNPIKKELSTLERGCIGLGMLDTIPGIEVGHTRISKGTQLIAYTDGLVEVDNGNRVESSVDQLITILKTSKNIGHTMEMIQQMSDEHRQNGLVFDDISVLGIEFVKKGLLCIHS